MAFVLVFASCEEIVDINLHDGNQQLVVNAVFASESDTVYMDLSTTGRFTDGAGIGPVSNASIAIIDQAGSYASFNEALVGRYFLTNYSFVIGNTYTLTVTDGEKTAQASSTVPAKAIIDSVRLELIEFSGFEFTIVHVYTTDPSAEANFFRTRLSYNHQGFYTSSNAVADAVQTTEVMDVALVGGPFLSGDTLTLELWSMNDEGYQFYRTLNQAANSDPSSTASPFNVSSNVVGGLGLFCLYQRDEYTVVVP